MIGRLSGIEVMLERRANEQGHLYGAVSATDIAKSLEQQGYEVGADDIYLPGKLDQINNYTVRVKFAEELETEIKVWVAPDADSKAAIDAARKTRESEPAPASPFERSV